MMTVGELLKALEAADTTAHIEFDFCQCVPQRINSWRGVYAEPALSWCYVSVNYRGPKPTVEDTLRELRHCLSGWTYLGWKGGEFVFTADSCLHVDNFGDCSNTEITQIEDLGHRVILHTRRGG